MTKKMRQTVTIVALCVILVGSGIGYYAALKYQNKKSAEDTEDTSINLYSLDEDSITSISFKNSKANMSFQKKNDEWVYTEDKNFPVNQTYVDTMVSDVAAMTATKLVVSDCTDLSEYELDEPSLQVEIEDSDGNKQSLTVGLESVAAEGCYAYTDDSSKVYVIASSFTSDFEYTMNQMMALPDTPDITAEYVTSYSVDARKGDDFKAVYDEKNSKYTDLYSWDITDPFTQAVAGDQDSLSSAFSGIASVAYTEGVTYKESVAILKKYGLANPAYSVDVKYYEVQTDDSDDTSSDSSEGTKVYHRYRLLVGNKNSAGDSYYVKVVGKKGVYLMSSDVVKSIVKIDAFSCVYSTPYVDNTNSLKSVAVSYKGTSYDMTLTKKKKKNATESTDASDESNYNYTAKVNGQKVDDEAFRLAYEAFGDITYSGQISDDVTPVSDTPVATLTFREKKKTVTVSFLPYDGDNFYRVKVDGVMQFVVDKETVDKDLKNLVAVAK